MIGRAMDLKDHIRSIPDFPKEGILFYDISTLLAHPDAWQVALGRLAKMVARYQPDILAGIESRGFLVAAPLASRLGLGFTMIRKKGKLPGDTIGYEYDLEYGTDTIEIHTDAIAKGDRVLLVDDLIATGGTAEAAANLIEKSGGVVVECCFMVDLPDVGGRARLETAGYKVFSLCAFEGD